VNVEVRWPAAKGRKFKKSMQTIDSPVSRFRIDGYTIEICIILCPPSPGQISTFYVKIGSRPRGRERN
jgi:hypothetical protein